MRSDSKRQAHVHAARKMLDRGVDKPFDFGKRDDLVEFALDFGFLHTQDRAVQIDVLATGEFGMKSRAHLEQRANPAPDLSVAFRRLGNAREDLEQSRLAG